MTTLRKRALSASELAAAIDLPHKRVPGWTDPDDGSEISRERLEFYAQWLLKLGMTGDDIAALFRDLCWDSFGECLANRAFEKVGAAK